MSCYLVIVIKFEMWFTERTFGFSNYVVFLIFSNIINCAICYTYFLKNGKLTKFSVRTFGKERLPNRDVNVFQFLFKAYILKGVGRKFSRGQRKKDQKLAKKAPK